MRSVVVCVVLVALLVSTTGCASICYPSRAKLTPAERNGVDWAMVLLDIFCWGGLGLIVDLATGALWRPLTTGYPAPPQPATAR